MSSNLLTPLGLVMVKRNQFHEAFEILIKTPGVDLNQVYAKEGYQNNDGVTPLMLTIRANDFKYANELFKHGADVNRLILNEQTPLTKLINLANNG